MAELAGLIVGGIIWGHVFARILIWARVANPVLVALLVTLIALALCRIGFDYLAPVHFILAVVAAGVAFFTAHGRKSPEQN